MLHALLLTFGLVALIFSAEVLARGAAGLARSFGVPSLVAGATLLAFATSAPPLTVALQGMLAGHDHVAIGTVVGANIFNVLFILALGASLVPLVAAHLFIRLEVPALIIACLLLVALAVDGTVSMIDAVILVAGLGAFTLLLVIYSLHDMDEVEKEPPFEGPDRRGRIWRKYGKAHRIFYDLCLVAFGVVLLIMGAEWLLEAAPPLGARFGLSETATAVTVIAACVALPGAATALSAILRGEPELAVGTVLGSSTFNILGVVGVSALLSPGGLAVASPFVGFDMAVMVAAAIACLPLIFIGNRLEPWQGAILVAVYVGYVSYLVMNPAGHDAAGSWRTALLAFVLPVTAFTFAVIVWRKLWAITEAEA